MEAGGLDKRTSDLFLMVSNFVFVNVEKAFGKISQRKDCWRRRWLFVSEQLVS